MTLYIRNDLDYIYLDMQNKHLILDELKRIFSKYYPSYDIVYIDTKSQLDTAYDELKDEQTLSLDCWYKGTYNVRCSRIFKCFDEQIEPISFFIDHTNFIINRQWHNVVIVDDDISTGYTLNTIMKMLGIKKSKFIYTLIDATGDYDVIDIRDFIFGSQYGGLVIETGQRVPYIFPYVNLENRASLMGNYREFSNEIVNLNMEIFKNTDLTHDSLLKFESVSTLNEWYKKYAKY